MSNIPLDLALPKIIHEEMSKFGEVLRIKVGCISTYLLGRMAIVRGILIIFIGLKGNLASIVP